MAKTWLVKVGVGGAIALIAFSLFVDVNFASAECGVCGAGLWGWELWGAGSEGIERRPITDWYDRRIRRPHEHDWTWMRVNSQALASRLANGWKFNPGVGLGAPASVKALLRLEPLDLDVPVYEEIFRRGEGTNSLKACNALLLVRAGWTDAEVGTWWDAYQSYLKSPDPESSHFPDFFERWKSQPRK